MGRYLRRRRYARRAFLRPISAAIRVLLEVVNSVASRGLQIGSALVWIIHLDDKVPEVGIAGGPV